MSRHTPGMRRWLLTLEEEQKMTTQQPEALRLAAALDVVWAGGIAPAAAAELRRLHESNQELLAALKRLMGETTTMQDAMDANQQARAAINKAGREQK